MTSQRPHVLNGRKSIAPTAEISTSKKHRPYTPKSEAVCARVGSLISK